MTSGRPTESIYSVAERLVGPRPRNRGTTPHPSKSRSRRRNKQKSYSVNDPAKFRLERFAKVDNLHVAFRVLERDGGHGPGNDGLKFEDFSPGEVFAALRRVSRAILERTYKPYPTRTHLIAKGDGRFRTLSLQRLTDRTAAKALQLCLNDYWRLQLPGIGRSVWHIYAAMQRVMRERKTYVLAIDDVKDCFPSAKLEDVFQCHRQHIPQPDLLWLIENIVRGHDGLEHTTGLDQGSPYSPVAMELLLHTHLDKPLETRCQGYPLLRYVDNLTLICNSEREGLETLNVTRELLAPIGLTLKGEDGEPDDIRNPGFNKTLLGFIPRWEDGQLKLFIPELGFEDLKKGLLECVVHSNPLACAMQVNQGWINIMGPAFTNAKAPEIVDRVISITRECGFLEFSRKKLSESMRRERGRWLEFSFRRGPGHAESCWRRGSRLGEEGKVSHSYFTGTNHFFCAALPRTPTNLL